MSLALAAELNGYPGPRHVLDLGEALDLTAVQRRAFESLFREMEAEARRLGAAILDQEAALDHAFGSGAVDEAGLHDRLAQLASLQAALRYAHLRTHLAAQALLTREQLARYDTLRGYDGDGGGAAAPSHGGHGAGAH